MLHICEPQQRQYRSRCTHGPTDSKTNVQQVPELYSEAKLQNPSSFFKTVQEITLNVFKNFIKNVGPIPVTTFLFFEDIDASKLKTMKERQRLKNN